ANRRQRADETRRHRHGHCRRRACRHLAPKIMKHLLLLCTLGTSLLAETPKILFDTDITGDVDDVLALAMCHTLADRGACELIGVTVSKNHPLTASFVDAQNTFYGRPNLPIGVTRDPAAQHR